jgi:hypothetical protein
VGSDWGTGWLLEAAGHWRLSRTGRRLVTHADVGAGRGGRRRMAKEVDVRGRPGRQGWWQPVESRPAGHGWLCEAADLRLLVPASEGSSAWRWRVAMACGGDGGPRRRPARSRWVRGMRVGSSACEWADVGVVYSLTSNGPSTFGGLWEKPTKIALTSGGPLGKNCRKFLNFRWTKVG